MKNSENLLANTVLIDIIDLRKCRYKSHVIIDETIPLYYCIHHLKAHKWMVAREVVDSVCLGMSD